MATPARAPSTCTLTVNLFDGTRRPFNGRARPLLTVRNGNQQQVKLKRNGFMTTSSMTIEGLPFFNNFGDSYAVIASANGFKQAGFHPVKLSPSVPAVVDIMLVPKEASFNFAGAQWKTLRQTFPDYANLLASGAVDDAAAANRYGQLMETKPEVLACFFNLVTSMSQVNLPAKTPLAYFKQLIWDGMAQDRFFAWADTTLVDQVVQAAAHAAFTAEPGTALCHPGATRSWKQMEFGEANLQLTFHENDTKTISGIKCIKVEPDIDYFKDLLAHAILEVLVNGITHSLSDPKQVYVLRWMAGRHAGIPNFEPPYTLQ